MKRIRLRIADCRLRIADCGLRIRRMWRRCANRQVANPDQQVREPEFSRSSPGSVGSKLSALSRGQSAIRNPQSAIGWRLSALSRRQSAIRNPQSAIQDIRNLQSAIILPGICLVFFACGYRVKAPVAIGSNIRTLAIPTLKNATSVFQVEQRLTRALIEEFSRRSPYKIVSAELAADAAIRGEVAAISAVPVIVGRESFGTTFLVTLNARVVLVDLKTNAVLFRNDQYLFREQYVINGDVKQFFSELNPALDRIARDFAQSVAATIMSRR